MTVDANSGLGERGHVVGALDDLYLAAAEQLSDSRCTGRLPGRIYEPCGGLPELPGWPQSVACFGVSSSAT
jgi:hypothetical protein